MDKKKEYIAPTLSLHFYKVEVGFVVSNSSHQLQLFMDGDEGFNDNGQQQWTTETNEGYFGTWS